MHDGITLERRGLPTAVIVTAPFVGAARAMARLDGDPDYPFAVVAHPVGDLTRDALRAMAAEVVDDVERLLLG